MQNTTIDYKDGEIKVYRGITDAQRYFYKGPAYFENSEEIISWIINSLLTNDYQNVKLSFSSIDFGIKNVIIGFRYYIH